MFQNSEVYFLFTYKLKNSPTTQIHLLNSYSLAILYLDKILKKLWYLPKSMRGQVNNFNTHFIPFNSVSFLEVFCYYN